MMPRFEWSASGFLAALAFASIVSVLWLYAGTQLFKWLRALRRGR